MFYLCKVTSVSDTVAKLYVTRRRVSVRLSVHLTLYLLQIGVLLAPQMTKHY